MDTDKVIKNLEYIRRIAGLPEQGDNWAPNASTIAIDHAIEAVKFKEELSKEHNQIQYTDVPGHTKYLQGFDMPIMINSIWSTSSDCEPSTVSEMHIGKHKDKDVILITPEIIALPETEDNPSTNILDNKKDYAMLLSLLTKYSPESIARVINYKLYKEDKVKIVNDIVLDLAGLKHYE